ncbi:hypothetical protein B0H12DRAFT_1145164 [Mycena haematopus]|nr:hypothetical protein B0H12DRAFT_1145164 [Mycena haematopus]
MWLGCSKTRSGRNTAAAARRGSDGGIRGRVHHTHKDDEIEDGEISMQNESMKIGGERSKELKGKRKRAHGPSAA